MSLTPVLLRFLNLTALCLWLFCKPSLLFGYQPALTIIESPSDGSFEFHPLCVSPDGQWLGGYRATTSSKRLALWNRADGPLILPDELNERTGEVFAIATDAGFVCGNTSGGTGPVCFVWNRTSDTLEWSPEWFTGQDAAFVEGTFVVVGTVLQGNIPRAAIWRPPEFRVLGTDDLQAYQYSFGVCVSDDAQWLGGSGSLNGHQGEGFGWSQSLLRTVADLEGGMATSSVNAISGDGIVLVGRSHGALGWDMIRSSSLHGTTALGCDMTPTSADVSGYIIVGEAFGGGAVWNAACGTQSLALILIRAGISGASEWHFGGIQDITPNGRTAVGNAYAPGSGRYAAYIADLPTLPRTDHDQSGWVDGDDFDAFVDSFELGVEKADYDGTGFVDTDDFTAFVLAFEQGC